MAGSTEAYNLSLSHVSDLTGAAMGFFRGPLAATAIGMLGIGLGSYLLRRARRTYAANLTLAASMTVILLAAHEGLVRFYPILGSKGLAQAISHAQQATPHADDLILIDGELTAGSTLIFYTGQQVHLINGRVNGLWYGSFWPDAPPIFETEDSLRQLWASPRRIFLFTYDPAARTRDLAPYGAVHTLASAGRQDRPHQSLGIPARRLRPHANTAGAVHHRPLVHRPHPAAVNQLVHLSAPQNPVARIAQRPDQRAKKIAQRK